MIICKEKIFKDLKHKHYGLFGDHSAVEICEWNKKALKGEAVCYKQKFYNVDCHRCAQITPTVIWCHQNCIFCWRPVDYMTKYKLTGKIDKPKEIIENLFFERKKLLTGFGGNVKVSPKLYKESQTPTHIAISLSGEPTIYPYLPDMIKYLKTKKEIKTIFIVTNGLEPNMLLKLSKEKALPTQLYLSIESCNEKMHKKINKPKIKESWKRFNQTINLFSKLKCRRVLRYTMIKGLNDSIENLKDFIKIFEKTDADFLEIKSYMHIGASRDKMIFENMPRHSDVLKYSKELEKISKKFKIEDQDAKSRIVLLKNKNSKYKNFIK